MRFSWFFRKKFSLDFGLDGFIAYTQASAVTFVRSASFLSLGGRYNFRNQTRLTPYLGGQILFTDVTEIIVAPLFGQAMKAKQKDIGGGFGFIGGCDFRVTNNISLSGEGRFSLLHLKYDSWEVNGVSGSADSKREYDTGGIFLGGGLKFSF